MYIGKGINMELEHKELTEKIIGAAIQVHQQNWGLVSLNLSMRRL